MQHYVVDVLGRGFVRALTADKVVFTADSNRARVFGSVEEVAPYVPKLSKHGRIFVDAVDVEVITVIRRSGKPSQELKSG